jgi:flagellar biogenesis protein FliO
MPHLSQSPIRLALVAPLAIAIAWALSTSAAAVDADDARAQRDGARYDATHQTYDAHATTSRTGIANVNAPNVLAETGPTLPLASKRLPAPVGESAPKTSGWSTLFSALGSLTIVLGLFLAVMWFVRRTGPKAMLNLPGEVFEVLGRSPLAGRQQAQLVRCGNKLLLLSVTAGGAETLTEITDPAEVERLTGLCQQSRPNSATASFRNLFSHFAAEPPSTSPRSPRANLPRLGGLSQRATEAADA